MTTVKQAIHEHDVVTLTQAVDKDQTLTQPVAQDRAIGQWPAGTIAAVVSDYGDHKLIEITNDRGEALDFVTVPIDQLELVTKSLYAPYARV